MQRLRYAIMAAFSLGAFTITQAAVPGGDGWVSLVTGDSLDGWVQRGGKAKYKVENGEIVGTSVPNTPNSFLCTAKDYGNFELEVDFKVNPALNSGVQVRSEYVPEGKEVTSGGVKVSGGKAGAGGRVFGYQVEIDPSERAYTGGIYDEGRRKWLKDLKDNEPARKAFKAKDWNHFRIACTGDSIKVWLNDVPAAEISDSVTPKGFIALQVHGVGKKEDPLEVRWKNIRLKELN